MTVRGFGRRVLGVSAACVVGAAACRRTGSDEPTTAAKPSAPAAVAAKGSPEPARGAPNGAAVYAEHCAVCHMANGRGVPNMQPSLVGSPFVSGDPVQLEQVIRGGSAVLATRRPNPFGTEMPPFGYLSPEEVEALVGYLREQFGQP